VSTLLAPFNLPACPIEILELAQVCWQRSSNIFVKEHLVKNWLISTLNNVIYFNFSGVYKTSLHFTKWGGDQLKYFLALSNILLLPSVAPRISMACPHKSIQGSHQPVFFYFSCSMLFMDKVFPILLQFFHCAKMGFSKVYTKQQGDQIGRLSDCLLWTASRKLQKWPTFFSYFFL
jgi:hypothetical protein